MELIQLSLYSQQDEWCKGIENQVVSVNGSRQIGHSTTLSRLLTHNICQDKSVLVLFNTQDMTSRFLKQHPQTKLSNIDFNSNYKYQQDMRGKPKYHLVFVDTSIMQQRHIDFNLNQWLFDFALLRDEPSCIVNL